MRKAKFYTVFALLTGIGMIGLWTMLLMTGQVPELQTAPAEIYLHLAAEFSTALLLVLSALLLLRRRPLGHRLVNIAYGMLLYTLIVSPGYYITLGETPMAIMFGTLFLLTAFALIQHLRE